MDETLPHAKTVSRIADCHAKWQATSEATRLPFVLFLAKEDHAAFVAARIDPRICLALPKPIQRSWRRPKGHPLGAPALERYAIDLVRRYQASGMATGFETFLKSIAVECSTEAELRQFLGLR